MIITLIKKQKSHEALKDYEKKYGSIKEVERLYNDTGNYLYLVDLDNWTYYKDNPEEMNEQAVSRVTNKLTLSDMKIEILDFIKNKEPESIRELARFLNKDVKLIHPKIKELEQEGLIELKTGDKNKKIPILNYDEISIAI